MLTRKYIAVGVLSAMMLIGCGSNNGVSPTDPGTTPVVDPYTPNDPGYNPAPQPTPAPALQDVTASVSTKKKTGGFLLWFKKVDAQISVTNPNQSEVSATLTITFTKGGKSVETQTQSVDLAAGETRSIEAKATKTSDDLSVSVAMSGGVSGGGYPTGGGSDPYSGGSGYPSTGGGYPSSGGYSSSPSGTSNRY